MEIDRVPGRYAKVGTLFWSATLGEVTGMFDKPTNTSLEFIFGGADETRGYTRDWTNWQKSNAKPRVVR